MNQNGRNHGTQLREESQNKHSRDSIEALRALYPSLTDEEIEEAEANLQEYVAVVLRIWQRLQQESDEGGGFDGR